MVFLLVDGYLNAVQQL
jgi:hypothetical protein